MRQSLASAGLSSHASSLEQNCQGNKLLPADRPWLEVFWRSAGHLSRTRQRCVSSSCSSCCCLALAWTGRDREQRASEVQAPRSGKESRWRASV